MPRAARSRSLLRPVIFAALALAASVHVVRSALVQQFVATRPDLAVRVWPGHPEAAFALTMAEIGAAAGRGEPPPPSSLERARAAAQRAPLAVEPFLIEGAVAQHQGDPRRAERLFVEAARRDPRSAAARYFLAQRYLTSGRTEEGLRQAAVLARVIAGGSAALVPAIVAYAKTSGAVPALRSMFARDPLLRDAVLTGMAQDAANHDLIVALAGDTIGTVEPAVAPAWQGILLRALVARDEVARARTLWLRISGLATAPVGLFNPQFARHPAPAPFNWTYGNGDFGFAEPAANGALQVSFYGRSNGQFASQTLLLAPGSYELKMRVLRSSDQNAPSGLAWTLSCGTAAEPLFTLPVGDGEGAARAVAGRFTVPAGCTSQTIRLIGRASDIAAAEQISVDNLQLVRLAS